MWWVGFNLFVIGMIALDIAVFHKKDSVVSMKEALTWSFVWVALALLFNVGIYFWFGKASALEYFTGYIIEKSLSIDNLFVFITIFQYFRVPPQYQHRVLFYGILIAMILRAFFILVGIKLVNEFEWILFIFGIFLIYIAVKTAFEGSEEYDPSKNPAVKIFSRFMPLRSEYDSSRFIVKENGKWHITQLFVVLMVINVVDIVFAVDSIPAIFAITRDPFIVYTSNIFAILGLRALYFAIAGVMGMFHYLKYGLAVILAYVGFKMIITHWIHIDTLFSLVFIVSVITVTIIFSIVRAKRVEKADIEDIKG
ncbi:MAG TPA: TerC family protein [Firmicutes bacterium]|nr:TerC family protein [Bacillota bacterium]